MVVNHESCWPSRRPWWPSWASTSERRIPAVSFCVVCAWPDGQVAVIIFGSENFKQHGLRLRLSVVSRRGGSRKRMGFAWRMVVAHLS